MTTILYKPATVFLFFSILHVAQLSAQQAKYNGVRLLNQNHSFENGTTGWNDQQIPATIIERNWEPGIADSKLPFFEFSASYGQRLIKLQNSGLFGQSMPIDPANRKHMLNAFAFKQPAGSKSVAGYAAVGVSYYSLDGVLLDNIELEVGYANNQFNRGVGDGLQFYSWGIEVPDGATVAYVYAYNPPNTVTFLDNLGLFEITNPTSGSSVATNQLANNTFAFTGVDTKTIPSNPIPYVGYGIEFWDSSLDWSNREFFDSFFGSVNQDEWVTQVVPVKPGRTYALFGVGNRTNTQIKVGYGVEFYDSNRKLISNRPVTVSAQNALSIGDRYVAPANASFALVYWWVGKLQTPGNYTFFNPEFYEVAPRATNATSVTVTSGEFQGDKGGTRVIVSVLFTDVDGIDVRSLDVGDVQFTSKTSSTLYSPGSVTVLATPDRRTVKASYSLAGNSISDIRGIMIRPNQVKDSRGNFVPTKTFTQVFR